MCVAFSPPSVGVRKSKGVPTYIFLLLLSVGGKPGSHESLETDVAFTNNLWFIHPMLPSSQQALQLLSQRTSTLFRSTYIPLIASAWTTTEPAALAHDVDYNRRVVQWTIRHQWLCNRAAAIDPAPRIPYITAAVLGYWCATSSHFADVFSFACPMMAIRLAFTGLTSAARHMDARAWDNRATVAADWAVVWCSPAVLEALPGTHVQALCDISEEAYQDGLDVISKHC
jgi:hypothetical protein